MFEHVRTILAGAAFLLLVLPRVAISSQAVTTYYEVFPGYFSGSGEAWFGQSADLDGDGRDELLTGWYDYSYSSPGGFIQVRSFGPGAWATSTATAIRVSLSDLDVPGRIAAADLDGDGDLDLVVPVSIIDTLVLVPNLGSGSFGAPIFLYEPGLAAVAAADFDGDGLADIAITSYSDAQVRILHATAPFTYFLAEQHAFPKSYTEYLDLADLNGDTAVDLVLSADTAGTVLLGNGSGGFTSFDVPLRHAVPAGDLNGDGKGDLMNLSAIYLGNGDGTFQPGLPFAPLVANTTVDLDEDGRLDLVGIKKTTPFAMLSVQRGLGDGTFGPATLHPYNRGGANVVVAGDFDGDGHQDIAQTSRKGADGVLFGLGNGLFPEPIVVPNPMSVRYLRAGRFGSGTNRDLLVVSSTANSMTLRLRTGLAQWSAPDSVLLPGTPGAWGPEVADLNSDGRDDIVLAYDDLSTISYWLTDATGHLGPRTDLPGVGALYPRTIEIAVGDVDGDGDADILYQRTFDGGVQYDGLPLSWYAGAGDGTFTDHGTLPYVTIGNLEIGDLSGDGVPDLAMMNRNYGIRTVIATAPGVFGAYTDLAPLGIPYSASHFVKGHLSSSSTLDLALTQNVGVTSWMFRGNGSGTFATPFAIARPGFFGNFAYAADLDGDGRDEIISGTTVIRLRADGTLEEAVGYGPSASATSGASVVMDVDGNGALDLVCAVAGELFLKVMLNRTPPQFVGVGPPTPRAPALELSALQNPSRGSVSLRLTAAYAGPVTVELIDVQGRRVASSTPRAAPRVPAAVPLGRAGRFAPGVYLAVARQGDQQSVARVVVIR